MLRPETVGPKHLVPCAVAADILRTMSASKRAVTVAPRPEPTTEPADAGPRATGVLPSQQLREAVTSGWITAGDWRIPPESIQPASVDLRLGEFAWALRCSFLPDVGLDRRGEDRGSEVRPDRPSRRGHARARSSLPCSPDRGAAPAGGDSREDQSQELDGTPGRVHAGDHRPQPPLRRDRGGLPRQALPGGRSALVRDPGQAWAVPQPGPSRCTGMRG